MNHVFKVGEICIGQNFIYSTECNGMECEIIGGLELRAWESANGKIGEDLSYLVRWADGHDSCELGRNLRPKKPPRHWLNEVVSWEAVGWMPFEVKFDRAIKQSLRDQLREKA